MTKALQLARSFHLAGHRVVLGRVGEVPIHRTPVLARGRRVPLPCPSRRRPGYAEALPRRRRRARGSTSFVPVSSPGREHSRRGARALLDAHCEVIHADPETVTMLDDKTRFSSTAASFGLRVPDFTTGSPTRSRSRTSTSRRAATTSSSGSPTTPSAGWISRRLTARHARAQRRVRPQPAHLGGRPVDPAGIHRRPGVLHARHGPQRRAHRCTAAASRRPSRSTTPWWTSPRSVRWVEHSSSRSGMTGQVSFDFIEARRRPRLRHRVQPAHPLGHHDVLRPSRCGGGIPRRRPPGDHPAARLPARRTGSTTRSGDCSPNPAGAAPAARPSSRAPTPSSRGGIHCPTCWCTTCRSRRCWSDNLRRGAGGRASTSTSASSSRRRRLMSAHRPAARRLRRSTSSMPICPGCTRAVASRRSSTIRRATRSELAYVVARRLVALPGRPRRRRRWPRPADALARGRRHI